MRLDAPTLSQNATNDDDDDDDDDDVGNENESESSLVAVVGNLSFLAQKKNSHDWKKKKE